MDRTEGPWVVRRPATVAILVGDLLVIAGLVAWGLTMHEVDPIDRSLYTLRTAAPFIFGWVIMGPLAGAFSRRAFTGVTTMALATAAAWVGAALIGVAIRATPLVPGGADPVFVLVMVGTGLAAMIPWRLVVFAAAARLGLRRAH